MFIHLICYVKVLWVTTGLVARKLTKLPPVVQKIPLAKGGWISTCWGFYGFLKLIFKLSIKFFPCALGPFLVWKIESAFCSFKPICSEKRSFLQKGNMPLFSRRVGIYKFKTQFKRKIWCCGPSQPFPKSKYLREYLMKT